MTPFEVKCLLYFSQNFGLQKVGLSFVFSALGIVTLLLVQLFLVKDNHDSLNVGLNDGFICNLLLYALFLLRLYLAFKLRSRIRNEYQIEGYYNHFLIHSLIKSLIYILSFSCAEYNLQTLPNQKHPQLPQRHVCHLLKPLTAFPPKTTHSDPSSKFYPGLKSHRYSELKSACNGWTRTVYSYTLIGIGPSNKLWKPCIFCFVEIAPTLFFSKLQFFHNFIAFCSISGILTSNLSLMKTFPACSSIKNTGYLINLKINLTSLS